MRAQLLTEADRPRWNHLVQEAEASGFMQSWEWSLFKEAEGQSILRLGLLEGAELIGGALVYYVDSSLGLSPLEVPHGPILPWSDPSRARQGAALIHSELRELAGRAQAPLIRIEPFISGEIPYWPGDLVRAPIDLVPTPTLMIDLARSEEAILGSMKPKGRYNIRLALRKGVEVFWSERPDAVDELYAIFEVTSKHHDFLAEPRSFFVNMIRTLGPMVRIYFAAFRGMILSTAVVILFGRRATFLYGGSLPFCRSVMAPYAMHWQIMRDARSLGCRQYDLFGIAPANEPAHRYARFSQFKSRFGGEVVRAAGAHDEYLYRQLAALWIKKLEEMSRGPN